MGGDVSMYSVGNVSSSRTQGKRFNFLISFLDIYKRLVASQKCSKRVNFHQHSFDERKLTLSQ